MNPMGDRQTTVHKEFEQLLEAEWAGELSEAGRLRMASLCAADPALAERLCHERRLSSLLSEHGPNHAPKGLAALVLARLEPELPETNKLAKVNIAGAIRKGSRRQERPWSQWWPVLRWGLATAVIGIVILEGGLLVRQELIGRESERAKEILMVKLEKPTEAQKSRRKSARELAALESRKVHKAKGVSAQGGTDGPEELEEDTGQELAMAHEEKVPLMMMRGGQFLPGDLRMMTSNATDGMTAQKSAAGAKDADILDIPTAPQAVAASLASAIEAGEAASVSDGTERAQAQAPASIQADNEPFAAEHPIQKGEDQGQRIAMHVVLNPTAMAQQMAKAKVSDKKESKKNSLIVPAEVRSSFFGGNTKPKLAPPSPEQASIKEIEMAAASVGGDILSSGPVPGRPGLWRIRCAMTPQKFQRFMREWKQSGASPVAPAVSSTPAAPPYSYEMIEGSGVLRSIATAKSAENGTDHAAKSVRAATPAQPASAAADRFLEVVLLIEQPGAARPAR